MGTITIQAHQPKYQLRFQDAAPAAGPAANAAAEPGCKQSDQICLTGRKTEDKAPKTLNLFDETAKAASQQYMERLTTRQSSFSVGPDIVQLQVSSESSAPELLTSSKEPDAMQQLQSKIQNMNQSQNKASGEQVIRTGAVFQPDEAIQIQIGMASAVDTGKLMAKDASGQDPIRPGMYAGVALKNDSISGRLAVDTAFGKPRVEVGTALAAGQSCTVGVSYLQSADDKTRTLRLGTEVHANQDTVVGLNLNQPLNQTTQVNGNTAVGVYVNTRF